MEEQLRIQVELHNNATKGLTDLLATLQAIKGAAVSGAGLNRASSALTKVAAALRQLGGAAEKKGATTLQEAVAALTSLTALQESTRKATTNIKDGLSDVQVEARKVQETLRAIGKTKVSPNFGGGGGGRGGGGDSALASVPSLFGTAVLAGPFIAAISAATQAAQRFIQPLAGIIAHQRAFSKVMEEKTIENLRVSSGLYDQLGDRAQRLSAKMIVLRKSYADFRKEGDSVVSSMQQAIAKAGLTKLAYVAIAGRWRWLWQLLWGFWLYCALLLIVSVFCPLLWMLPHRVLPISPMCMEWTRPSCLLT